MNPHEHATITHQTNTVDDRKIEPVSVALPLCFMQEIEERELSSMMRFNTPLTAAVHEERRD